jgi:hypothetical protein
MVTRKEILQMLSEGTIDVARATEMLNDARESSEPAAPPIREPEAPAAVPVASKPPATGKPGRRWLHVHVSDLESGRQRVKVNVPLGLVNFGLKIGARFTDEMDETMMHDVLTALQDESLTGTLVEVEDLEDNERVHIFID